MDIWYLISANVNYKGMILIILHNHLDEEKSFEFFGMQWFGEKNENQKLATIFIVV